MMAKQESAKLKQKHEFFLADFENIQCAVRDVRMQCLSDRRFYSVPGAQWDGAVGEQFENKPRFEFNKTQLAVVRVINEYRNNRITVDFIPKDGSNADDLADTCDGLFRADEQDSGAQEAYDNCFEEGTSGGMGALRLRARYEDEDDDEDDRQRIAIEPVFEADTCVFFSLDGKRQDKADAKRCYLLVSMTPEQYKEEWDEDPTDFPKMDITYSFEWATPDVVWIAEVYEIEQKEEVVHFFRGLALGPDEPGEIEITADELEQEGRRTELEATGFREIRQKRVKRPRVHKYLMSGSRILSDEGYIAGKCIPVIPFYGKRWFVDGIERCQGHVRLARDAQVLDNMIKSWLAEMAARFDVEKPIFTPEQIQGHAQMWADDAIKKYPYLLVNPIFDAASGQVMPAGPIAYTKSPVLPQAMAALAQMAAQSLEDMLGNQQAGEELQPNMSGKAVELVQNRLDMQTFIYVDNFRKTMKRVGEVWISMAKDLLVEEGREMKAVDQAGETSKIQLLQPTLDENGEPYIANDLASAKFDVNVDVGPSSNSRKAATVRAVTGMMQMTTDPSDLKVLTSMAMMNMEGEGLGELKPYWRKQLLNIGAVNPTEAEQKEIEEAQANAQPDPNAVFLMKSAEKEAAAAELNQAKVAQTHADTIAKLASVEQSREAHAIEQASKLVQMSQPQQPQITQQPLDGGIPTQ